MKSRIGMLKNETTGEGTFRDAEFMCMTRDFALAFKPLINDRVGQYLLKFFEEYDASDLKNNPETMYDEEICNGVELFREVVYDTARKMTLHLRVKDTNIFKTIYNLNLETAIVSITNKSETLEALRTLYKDRDAWVVNIPPRRKDDFVAFRKEVVALQKRVMDLVDAYTLSLGEDFVPANNPYLVKCIDMCKSYFYDAREKGTRTQIGVLLNRADDIEKLMVGLEYQVECDKKGLSLKARREVPIKCI